MRSLLRLSNRAASTGALAPSPLRPALDSKKRQFLTGTGLGNNLFRYAGGIVVSGLIRRGERMKNLDVIVIVLLIVGGLNWLLVGLFQFDLVAAIFGGQGAALSRIIYTIVGLCALYRIFMWKAMKARQ